jgi:frataxin-like iron-binding protein CyaY
MIIRQDQRPLKMIWVTFQKEGIHCYPAAATDPNLATGDQYDVSFLANPHRHIFHFRVWLSVTHNDRDVEFIQFKRWLEQLYSSTQGVLSLDHKSCEMMSDELYDMISKKYPSREVWIEVSEDGENGSFIKY